MLRMNREKNTVQNIVRKKCANYNTGFNCSGVMIGRYLQQWIDREYYNKTCKLTQGQDCQYYNQCIKPVVDV